MASASYYKNIIGQLSRRAIEASVGIWGINNKALRQHLVDEFGINGHKSSFLADPVFESLYAWEPAKPKMNELSGSLLQSSLIAAMDQAEGHRFGQHWHPFQHQLIAWQHLLNNHKSIVVTSGTGSGKTECFMVPILNDLAQEYEQAGQRLEGVRALFLYPLNALINSQRERLRAWTAPYGDGLRFCLYNGNTEENKHKDQAKVRNEVLTRQALRKSPPPMLVTNATMLEYMLVRQIDEPIIERSRGKLRWIVLDEAHTYVGSQAAELSLLLRRVLHTFGVEAKNVRFVATSATIGDADADDKLKKYLAGLAGVGVEQIELVGGRRLVPALVGKPVTKQPLSELVAIEPDQLYSSERYNALIEHRVARRLRDILHPRVGPQALSEISRQLFSDPTRTEETLAWLDLCSYTASPGPELGNPKEGAIPFLPLRAHLFHQVVNGLWCCVNADCKHKQNTELREHWPFGRVYTERRNHCECGAPLFELVLCEDCNEPHLLTINNNMRLLQGQMSSMDEFNLDTDTGDEVDDPSEGQESGETWLLAPTAKEGLTMPLSLSPSRDLDGEAEETYPIHVLLPDLNHCSKCQYHNSRRPFYRRTLLGAPFYISNAMPVLLDAGEDGDLPLQLPYRGKRLITFTDSRQGTARIAVKMQQDAERDCIRSQLYSLAADNVASLDDQTRQEKQHKLEDLLKKEKRLLSLGEPELARDISEMADALVKELAKCGSAVPLSWSEVINALYGNRDVSEWMYNYYRDLNPELFNEQQGARTLVELLLIREFARRPRRKNSLETLGMVAVCYPTLQLIDKIPASWGRLNLDLASWQDYLKIALDFYVRQSFAIDVPRNWIKWVGEKLTTRTLVRFDSQEQSGGRILRWPQVNSSNPHRLVKLLIHAANLSLDNYEHVGLINEVLQEAWNALTRSYPYSDPVTGVLNNRRLLRPTESGLEFHLMREELAFKAITDAWICPQTYRLLDTTFCGLTPYIPRAAKKAELMCREVKVPLRNINNSQFGSDADRKQAVRQWLDSEPVINSLRGENLWTNISDRIVEGNRFFRAAEHSAQQSASRLDKYETDFKAGKLNILSCSTTMEMGVDIGGISVVAMNNVPPHPANYLQRSGRAGRRSETQALAFTICKDNPHERGVFNDPRWPFITSVPAPYISLNSARIVQRHINALLLGWFLKHELKVTEQNVLTLNCSWFFAAEPRPPFEQMSDWLAGMAANGCPTTLQKGVKAIIDGSVLASHNMAVLLERANGALDDSKKHWLPAYHKLQQEAAKVVGLSEQDPYRRKLNYDLKAMDQEYLLSELATTGFLPGYGFPTGVVTFDHYVLNDFKKGKYLTPKGDRIDNKARLRDRPARDLPVAIREYAPGAEVVLDGLVYRSAGILLNTQTPDQDFSKPLRMQVEWRCHHCGTIGHEAGSTFNGHCDSCGTLIEPANQREFITPEGFAVDFFEEPGIDVSTQSYIPVNEPWVNANTDLVPLFDPRLGAYRAGSEGHIFYHSSGQHHQGYAVCLRCGRAESMQANGDWPLALQPGTPHRRLQGSPGKNSTQWCEGGDEAYAIKQGVHLGATDQTDVFELYLKRPKENSYLRHHSGDTLSWTLAVALRQALADIHGIDAAELGYTVKPALLPDCIYPVATVVLFDRAGGGAGFASSAPMFLPKMLQNALLALECEAHCDSACQSCLLSYDTRFHLELLNRHVAAEYLRSLQPYLSVPAEACLFTNDNRFCTESLAAELLACSRQGPAVLRLFTSGDLTEWDISCSGLKDACLSWRNHFAGVELVLPPGDLTTLGEVNKEDLNALRNLGIRLLQLQQAPHLNGGSLLVQVTEAVQTMSFACSQVSASVPNTDWWQWQPGYLIKSASHLVIKCAEVAQEQLATTSVAGDVELELTKECDGKLNHFGSVLWQQLLAAHGGLQQQLKQSSLVGFAYTDSYISSPWTLMLLGECIDELRQQLQERWKPALLQITTAQKQPNFRANWVYAEWPDELKVEVIAEYVRQMNEQPQVAVLPLKEMPHGRSMQLKWDNNITTTIRFDHGFGCWSAYSSSRQWLDASQGAEQQVEQLYDLLPQLEVRFGKSHATQLFIKQR